MAEINLAIDYHGIKLAGSANLPDTGPATQAVLLLHGFTGSRIEFAYMFVDVARRLAAQGIAVFRFDFVGCGESEGRFVDLSIADQARQAGVLLDELAVRYPGLRWHVAGYSMGGLAAVVTAADRSQLASAVLIAPAGNLADIIGGVVAQAMPLDNGNVDFIGLEIGQSLLREARAFDLNAQMARLTLPVLVLHGGNDVVVPPAIGGRAAEWAVRGRCVVLAEADHGFCRGAHRGELAELIGEWVRGDLE